MQSKSLSLFICVTAPSMSEAGEIVGSGSGV